MTHWRELATEAEELLNQAVSTPARIRTVISRSYYAAFHACLQHAVHAGYARRHAAGGTHEQLLRFLTRQPGSSAYLMGKRLDRLRIRRVDADYQLAVRLTRMDAEDALDIMTEILTDLPAAGV
jgi:uncharacterized protein (UPF0332 family)